MIMKALPGDRAHAHESIVKRSIAGYCWRLFYCIFWGNVSFSTDKWRKWELQGLELFSKQCDYSVGLRLGIATLGISGGGCALRSIRLLLVKKKMGEKQTFSSLLTWSIFRSPLCVYHWSQLGLALKREVSSRLPLVYRWQDNVWVGDIVTCD